MDIYILIVIIIFVAAYFIYGKFLEKVFSVSENEPVPSKSFYDGVDFVPTNKFVLLGHHFSSIAGAGPIVGPIIAGIAFGWLGAILWIVIGTIFFGGVHDFVSLLVSVRHQGKSVAEVINQYVNKKTYKIFLIFVWLSLVYVVTVFADLAAETFAKESSVAEINILYIVIAVVFGVLIYKFKLKLSWTTIFMLGLLVIGIYYSINHQFVLLDRRSWVWILLGYCVIASILPVWLLLQPRDYMSSFLLYASIIVGLVGLLFGKFKISYPSVVSFNSSGVGSLVPFLFITIACGAISGFHSLVASGTTSKQLDSMKNARFVAYGGMILEGIVAAISLATVILLTKTEKVASLSPAEIYSNGVSGFVSVLGLQPNVGKVFGYLIISAFVLTTLDTATRIARYILQEFLEIKKSTNSSRILCTITSLLLPILLLNVNIKDAAGKVIPAWKVVWPLFGTTNQLLAAMVLVVIYIWMYKNNIGKKNIVLLPAIFMLAMTFLALGKIILGNFVPRKVGVITVIGIILFLLALVLIWGMSGSIRKQNLEKS